MNILAHLQSAQDIEKEVQPQLLPLPIAPCIVTELATSISVIFDAPDDQTREYYAVTNPCLIELLKVGSTFLNYFYLTKTAKGDVALHLVPLKTTNPWKISQGEVLEVAAKEGNTILIGRDRDASIYTATNYPGAVIPPITEVESAKALEKFMGDYMLDSIWHDAFKGKLKDRLNAAGLKAVNSTKTNKAAKAAKADTVLEVDVDDLELNLVELEDDFSIELDDALDVT